jgi:hypothetical protein
MSSRFLKVWLKQNQFTILVKYTVIYNIFLDSTRAVKVFFYLEEREVSLNSFKTWLFQTDVAAESDCLILHTSFVFTSSSTITKSTI